MIRSILFAILIQAISPLVFADVRPYALEVLIFARPEPVQSIKEVFPENESPAPQSFDLLLALNSGFKNLTPLPDSSRILKNSALRIQTQMNGQILFHKRWIHPLIANQSDNPWYQISGASLNGFKLNGFFRWSIDRFIEVDADVRVTREGMRQTPEGKPMDEVYALREFRKMSSKDIHYLDHPAFGVIIASEMIKLSDPQAQPADAVSASERLPRLPAQ